MRAAVHRRGPAGPPGDLGRWRDRETAGVAQQAGGRSGVGAPGPAELQHASSLPNTRATPRCRRLPAHAMTPVPPPRRSMPWGTSSAAAASPGPSASRRQAAWRHGHHTLVAPPFPGLCTLFCRPPCSLATISAWHRHRLAAALRGVAAGRPVWCASSCGTRPQVGVQRAASCTLQFALPLARLCVRAAARRAAAPRPGCADAEAAPRLPGQRAGPAAPRAAHEPVWRHQGAARASTQSYNASPAVSRALPGACDPPGPRAGRPGH
jgi:hypothetical protein